MNIKNMKIGVQISLAFLLILIMMGIMLGVAYTGSKTIQLNLDDIVKDNNYTLNLSQEMSESVHIVSRAIRTILLLNDIVLIEKEYKTIETAWQKYDNAFARLKQTRADAEGLAIRVKIADAEEAARDLNNQVLELARGNTEAAKLEATELLLNQAGPATQKWQGALDENIALQVRQTQMAYAEATQDATKTLTLMYILGFGVAVISILIVFFLTRIITRNIGYVIAIMKQLSKGNFSVDLFADAHQDEISMMFNTCYELQAKLVDVIHGIRSIVSEVTLAADQVSEGNTDLAQRTQEHAASLEEIASSMEEMTGTINQNAENAQTANQLAQAAREQAEKGGAVVNKTVSAMGAISVASKKIADIIGVIDEIAFQTNLLALNAAVEAARAGEQGRGFAVVATEVRNLAGRSATAAKEIKGLIKDSVEKVEEGTKLVNESGETLNTIVTSVKKVTDVVAEIAAASHEQAAGINQVNKSVLQMDEMTQQNAALVEEASASSTALHVQAQDLRSMMEFFKIKESAGTARAKPRQTAAPVPAAVQKIAPAGGGTGGKKALPQQKTLSKLQTDDDSDWKEF